MDSNNLSEAQKQAKEEELGRAQAFQEMSMTQGFNLQKAYYENMLKSFVNDMFNQEEKPISNFENQRQQLIGLKKMFGDIEYHIGVLENERKTTKPTSE